ncbi:MAG: HNH endonuclease [Pseudomonadota bacterium]|nr:HNH endonuclease [Pseudomonadota bacterium]
MAKAVFTTKVDPTYDDLPELRYHFPKTYLRQVEAAVGDWIVYYEPRRSTGHLSSRGGRRAYFATARVRSVAPDPQLPDHYYAHIADFIEFDRPVPFASSEHYFESKLQRDDGKTNKGAFGRSVRIVPDDEFELIVQAGFVRLLGDERVPEAEWTGQLAEEPAIFERPVVERMVARPFRDRAFAVSVKKAYDNTCAVTGLKLINGGGRSEVQAAHIRPVADMGPDSIRNGVALSSTMHWMFDRGLMSLDDDFSILLAKDKVPEPVVRMINPERRLILPDRPEFRPHPQFLRYHRETVFKG